MSTTIPKTVHAERVEKAIALRKESKTWEEIKDELGVARWCLYKSAEIVGRKNELMSAKPPSLDLSVGSKIGSRTITKLWVNGEGQPMVSAVCDCGHEWEAKEHSVPSWRLRNYCSKCAYKHKLSSILNPGDKRGWWEVIELLPPVKHRTRKGRVLCHGCGTIYERQLKCIQIGESSSCINCRTKYQEIKKATKGV